MADLASGHYVFCVPLTSGDVTVTNTLWLHSDGRIGPVRPTTNRLWSFDEDAGRFVRVFIEGNVNDFLAQINAALGSSFTIRAGETIVAPEDELESLTIGKVYPE